MQLLETVDFSGMSVRQFYKAHALAGLMATAGTARMPAGGIAALVEACTKMVDAMLAEDAEFAAKVGGK